MKKLLVLVAVVIAACTVEFDPKNCSTFMLKTADDLWVGHNLDESPELFISGFVCLNKRSQYRDGLTWKELTLSPEEYAQRVDVAFVKRPEPRVQWRSKYGSITFNSEGVDFPDGGMNEKGLSIFEMSMGGTQPPEDPKTPVLFICLWIQYLLDNFATVAEVVEHVSGVNPDGWSWHYFVSDSTGDFAIIEFIQGESVIHRGKSAPVPALCNSPYKRELERLEQNTGLGSMMRSLFGRHPRFVRAAQMLSDYDNTKHPDAGAYAQDLLHEIRVRRWNKWQVLLDPANLLARFRSEKNWDFRQIDLKNVDFSEGTPTLILDIHGEGSGDVSSQLQPYSAQKNLSLTRDRAERLFKERLTRLNDNGVTAEVYARRFADYSERIRNPSQLLSQSGLREMPKTK
jgi:choloylglycine hydrolase